MSGDLPPLPLQGPHNDNFSPTLQEHKTQYYPITTIFCPLYKKGAHGSFITWCLRRRISQNATSLYNCYQSPHVPFTSVTLRLNKSEHLLSKLGHNALSLHCRFQLLHTNGIYYYLYHYHYHSHFVFGMQL